MTTTPDFARYPPDPRVESATDCGRWVEVRWDDAETARFHHIWLADNAADLATSVDASNDLKGWGRLLDADKSKVECW